MNLVLSDKSAERENTGCFLSRSTSPNRRRLGVSLGILIVFCLATQKTSGSEDFRDLPHPCDNEIYCYGELLHTIQMAHLYPDSKTFVDMKLKQPKNETLYLFQKFMEQAQNKPNPYDLEKFVTDHFDPAGSEFEEWTPDDWIEKPQFLQGIKDHTYRNWAYQLNHFWKMLGKKMRQDVKDHPELYSIIYVPHPVIVPGGRFREFYYWDSYWIVKGLLLSEMYHTVKGMLENFLSIVENYGHIPNGGRVYYAMRSQPPMLIPMVNIYVEATNDTEFLKSSLNTLEMEFSYWMTNHSVLVNKDGVNYTLFRYIDRSQGPRPESYREDFVSALVFKTEKERQEHYSELKAAAESGWDFSSRWFIKNGTNKGNLTDLKTKYLIPVDLNAFLYWNADLLSSLFKKVGDVNKAAYYADRAAEILEAVTKVLWLDEVGAWLDYDLLNERERDYFYPTNISPLWTGCYDHTNKDYFVGKVMKYIQNKQIMVEFLGGIPTSLDHSGEQWDYPNAWPPLQHIVIVGLMNTGDVWAQELAFDIASRWVKSNFIAYNETGHMYEKYDAAVLGGHGGGGEYDVQLGFGWTNGIIMDLLHMYGDKLSPLEDDFEPSLLMTPDESNPEVHQSSAPAPNNLVVPLIITAVIFVSMFVGGSIW